MLKMNQRGTRGSYAAVADFKINILKSKLNIFGEFEIVILISKLNLNG
jgi:hypothetical protein